MKNYNKTNVMLVGCVAVILSIIVTACTDTTGTANVKTKVDTDGSEISASSDAEEFSEPSDEIRLIGWDAAIAHIDLVTAYEGGFFSEEGLTAKFVFNNSNPDNIQALIDGKTDLIGAGIAAELQYIDEGADLVVIGGQMSLGETVYALPERADEFTELNEETLTGKRIGVTRMNTGDVAFRKILADRGVDLEKIEFVELDSQATVIQAVINKEVDLGINFLTYRSLAEGEGLVPVSQLDAEDEWPDYICCRLVTTKKKLENDREKFVKALKANIKAYELIKNNHEKALEVAGKALNLERDVLEEQLYNYGHLGLSPNPNKRSIKEFYKAMVNVGYIEGNVNIDDYIDTTIYEDALNELIKEDPDNDIYNELMNEFKETNI